MGNWGLWGRKVREAPFVRVPWPSVDGTGPWYLYLAANDVTIRNGKSQRSKQENFVRASLPFFWAFGWGEPGANRRYPFSGLPGPRALCDAELSLHGRLYLDYGTVMCMRTDW